ncbi:MAG: hypothetical protein H7301_02435 [Cryobacterium sp.]|nr:hypothetical protein [Oligoflexia bacterium]
MFRLSQLRKFQWTPNRAWLVVFATWLFLLTGLTHQWGAGSPGLIQFSRLNGLLHERQAQLADSDAEIEKIDGEAKELEKSRVVQEREIRKTMGYVGDNELIFDFSLSRSAALRR